MLEKKSLSLFAGDIIINVKDTRFHKKKDNYWKEKASTTKQMLQYHI